MIMLLPRLNASNGTGKTSSTRADGFRVIAGSRDCDARRGRALLADEPGWVNIGASEACRASTTRITMAFEDEGFLSPDLASWIAATRFQFKDWFDLVDSFNQEAMKVLLAIKPSQSENQQLVASLLYRRALQSFQ